MTDSPRFPIIYSFDGCPSEDGQALLIEATGFDGSAVRFAVPVDNIQHFIAFLLLWVGTMSGGEPGEKSDHLGGPNSLPIPVTSIAIGETQGNEGHIGISVGRAELVFSLPTSAFGELGQTFLIAGNASNSAPA